MAKFKVLAVANSEEKRLMIRQRLAIADDLALVGFAAVDADIMSKIKGYAPHVVLLVQEQGDAGIMELAQRIYQGFPGCAIALLVPELDMELVRSAMHSGVRQVISEDSLFTINDQLVQAALFEQGRAIEAGGEPRIIAIYSGKGGVGRTTLAVNLATALAMAGRRTALVDLNLNLGDAPLLLNINAKDTLAELAQEKTSFTIEDIKGFSMQHSSGLSLLCAPASPEFAEYITARHVEMILTTMRPYYDFIVLDLPNDIADTTLTALENSDDIYVVAKKDISSLRATKVLITVMTTLQQQDKLHLVINSDRPGIVNTKDFDRILNLPIDYILPEDNRSSQLSQERGIPLVIGFPRSSLAHEINQMAQFLVDRSARKELIQPDMMLAGSKPVAGSKNIAGKSQKDKPVRTSKADKKAKTSTKPGLFARKKTGEKS
jgi:pilus assembly protein CpaE